MTWGLDEQGGDSSAVQAHLRKVRSIKSSDGAFAAILDNGFGVTWGLPDFGGDSSAVWQSLRNILQIQAARAAFAAVLSNGTIVSWGQLNRTGRTMDAVHNQVTADGSLVSWGHSCYGGTTAVM